MYVRAHAWQRRKKVLPLTQKEVGSSYRKRVWAKDSTGQTGISKNIIAWKITLNIY